MFDTNGDGVLSALDTDFSKFKLLVTNVDGSTSTKTLAELGITEIDLTADSTNIELSDGSVITGQTTFKRSDGTTGTVGDMLFRMPLRDRRRDEFTSNRSATTSRPINGEVLAGFASGLHPSVQRVHNI